MKQCPECKKSCPEGAEYCPSCGAKAVEISNDPLPNSENQVQYCTRCGTACDLDTSFCPKCGTPLSKTTTETALVSASSQEEDPAEEHTWRFEYERFSDGRIALGAQYTTISAKGTELTVEQSKRFLLFPYGKRFDRFDVRDITAIMQEKKISITSVFWILLSHLFLASGVLLAILTLALSIWMLKDTFIVIQHKRGGVLIKATKEAGGDPQDFLNYVRRYNPNCIRMFMA